MATYRSSVSGALRESESPMGYPWLEVSYKGTELAAPTADAILAQVGTDTELAQAALELEEAREKPRTTLVAKLRKITEAAP